jgi:hypothetical protein
MQWLLSPEPVEDDADTVGPIVEEVILSEDFMQAEDREEYLAGKLALPQERIERLAEKTVGQRSNPNWSLLRKMRLTASNFGAILRALRTGR